MPFWGWPSCCHWRRSGIRVARRKQVRILHTGYIGYMGTVPTKGLVLLTGRSSFELRSDTDRNEA
jgi:hypothetical protein